MQYHHYFYYSLIYKLKLQKGILSSGIEEPQPVTQAALLYYCLDVVPSAPGE